MSKVELRLSEKVVAEVVSLSRVFLGKNNSLGIRIASKAVSVKVRTADGEVQKQAMTPIALYTFENGEVEIPREQVIGTASDLFGDKVYADVEEQLTAAVEEIQRNV